MIRPTSGTQAIRAPIYAVEGADSAIAHTVKMSASTPQEFVDDVFDTLRRGVSFARSLGVDPEPVALDLRRSGEGAWYQRLGAIGLDPHTSDVRSALHELGHHVTNTLVPLHGARSGNVRAANEAMAQIFMAVATLERKGMLDAPLADAATANAVLQMRGTARHVRGYRSVSSEKPVLRDILRQPDALPYINEDIVKAPIARMLTTLTPRETAQLFVDSLRSHGHEKMGIVEFGQATMRAARTTFGSQDERTRAVARAWASSGIGFETPTSEQYLKSKRTQSIARRAAFVGSAGAAGGLVEARQR